MNEAKDEETSSSTSRFEKLISKMKDLEEQLNRSRNANVVSEEKRKAVEAKYVAYDPFVVRSLYTHTHTNTRQTPK